LALFLERLKALTGQPQRIGISATQGSVTDMAHFLLGTQETRSADVSSACMGRMPALQFAGVPPAIHDRSSFDTQPPCAIISLGHSRYLDLGMEIPASHLEAVMAGEVWGEIYDRLAALTLEHRMTLIFTNTRRLAERVAHHLSKRLGEGAVIAHHGSLAWEHRREAEGRLKAGALRALVATPKGWLFPLSSDRPGRVHRTARGGVDATA